ncbi:hypothetical protein RND81_13G177700 [Saponaria officinalis]|uniref:Epidermal patterning factor-like protein n=1 Tax=Saponaria officinalis TaxID=3572 RepID=A0AAW1H4E0_SAPOF
MVHLNIMMIMLLLPFYFVLLHSFSSTIEGRVLLNLPNVNSTTKSLKDPDNKIIWIRHMITRQDEVKRGGEVMGSRPPRCQGRCAPCGGRCVAVQVPWVSVSNIEYARGDHSSDYKPITWKCKCGHSLFNP